MEGKIPCDMNILQLNVTFNCGQCYRWNQQSDGRWIGVFRHCVWMIKHENGFLFYEVHGDIQRLLTEIDKTDKTLNDYCNVFKLPEKTKLKDEDFVNYVIWDFFRLFEDLEEHYKRWSLCDLNFRNKADQFYGLRMLKQDSEEVLFTFICSSNTTISRITTMVEQLCCLYGDKICDLNGTSYHDFPDVYKLAEYSNVEILKRAKFGYRAEYIVMSAFKVIREGGREWFKRLKEMKYEEAKTELMKLSGIGEKSVMSKPPKGPPKPTLEERFAAFARLGDTRGDSRGTHITLTQADKWMKQAAILDGKRVTYTDTGNAFNKFRSRSIQYPEFVQFVEELAASKRMDPQDLKEMLLKANVPGIQPEKGEEDNELNPQEKTEPSEIKEPTGKKEPEKKKV